MGSLAEEAAKLFAVMSGQPPHDHEPRNITECTSCPVCRTIHAVRHLSPDVTEHLVSAATSLAQAATALLSTQVPIEHAADHRDDPRSGDL